MKSNSSAVILEGSSPSASCLIQASFSGRSSHSSPSASCLIQASFSGRSSHSRRSTLQHSWAPLIQEQGSIPGVHRRLCRQNLPNGLAFDGLCSMLGPHQLHCKQGSLVSAAAWPKDKDVDMIPSAEKSDSANEELLLFFFQLDLTTRLQRALNLDQYEAAQQLRESLVEVDKEIARQKEAKLGSASSKDEAQDKAITILRLRNEQRKAVENEDYEGAAELRDQISKLEAESLAAAAKAMAYQNVQYAFRLGQKVRHLKFGYRGVICGMDPLCCVSHAASAKNLSRGQNQPFYQVLVDMKADPDLLVTYVSEENLTVPQESDKDRLEHPYVAFLFYGMDSAGDYIPIKQLRDKYGKPRHELPWEEDENDDSSNSGMKP